MSLPLLLSVPHAGLDVPGYLAPYCALTPEEIVKDGDEGARDIYQLADEVGAWVTTPIARAVLDMNRAEDDRRTDGVVKTHTCWNEPVYHRTPPEQVFERLLAEHYHPYHERLRSIAAQNHDLVLAVDCHTMAAAGPPVGPDPGVPRPMVCLGDGHGVCPPDWIDSLRDCFRRHFSGEVTINQPFGGGYITLTHGAEMPWLQLELSRSEEMSRSEKRHAVLAALRDWCRDHGQRRHDADPRHR